MDWSIFHWLNDATRESSAGQDAAKAFNTWAIVILLVVGGGLWLLARPAGPLRWKLATATAALSAVVGLIANKVLGEIWYHDRPFATHPAKTVLLIHHAKDNGFPSEHATVAFSVAFAVLLFSRPVGAFLVVLATAIALDRIFVGVHYPSDILASCLVGIGSALFVGVLGRPYVTRLVRLISRLTDPVVSVARRPLTRS